MLRFRRDLTCPRSAKICYSPYWNMIQPSGLLSSNFSLTISWISSTHRPKIITTRQWRWFIERWRWTLRKIFKKPFICTAKPSDILYHCWQVHGSINNFIESFIDGWESEGCATLAPWATGAWRLFSDEFFTPRLFAESQFSRNKKRRSFWKMYFLIFMKN